MPTKSKSKYQVMRSLTADEFRALKASIAEYGVLEPVLVDEDGNTIDGHHRRKACEQLGVDCPTKVVGGKNEDELTAMAHNLNRARRHLGREEMRQFIAEELQRDPKVSNREISRRTGADDKTVGSVRKELVEAGDLEKVDKVIGKDGKERDLEKPKRERKPKEQVEDPGGSAAEAAADVILAGNPEPKDDESLHETTVRSLTAINAAVEAIAGSLDGAGFTPEQWQQINELAERAAGTLAERVAFMVVEDEPDSDEPELPFNEE